jgi:hypothetical protein
LLLELIQLIIKTNEGKIAILGWVDGGVGFCLEKRREGAGKRLKYDAEIAA